MDMCRLDCNHLKTFLLNVVDIFQFIYHFMNPLKKLKCPSICTIEGATVLITGATRGIGKSAALELSKRGASNLILTCRNQHQANQLAEHIEQSSDTKVTTIHLDLTSLQSVSDCAQRIMQTFDHIDIFINNAGMAPGAKREFTCDGFEQSMQVNHIGPLLLTKLLLPLIKSKPGSRIIFSSSSSHRILFEFDSKDFNSDQQYSPHVVYAKTKLANILTTLYLSSILKGSNVSVNSFCPGPVDTALANDLHGLVLFNKVFRSLLIRTPEEGAQTLIHLAVEKSIESLTGLHFMDCKPIKTSRLASDFNLAISLWNESEELVKNYLKPLNVKT